MALAMSHVAYGDSLYKDLMQFNGDMEKLYSMIVKLKGNPNTRDKEFKKPLKKIDAKLEWWKTAEASHCFCSYSSSPLGPLLGSGIFIGCRVNLGFGHQSIRYMIYRLFDPEVFRV